MNRWPTSLRVNAFVRAVDHAGGQAMVLARGDRDAGMVLLLVLDRDCPPRLFEHGFTMNGGRGITQLAPDAADESELTAYWRRRRERDPDLWVVEAIVADAERLGAETLWAD